MIKGILMDFNGVIINDEPVQMRAYQEVLKEDDIDLKEEDYFSALGMDDRTFVAAAFERAGKKADSAKVERVVAAKGVKWRDAVADELPLVEGVEDFIAKMAKEFSMGIVSMCGRSDIEYVLTRANIRHYFSVIVSAQDVSNCKPDPEVFRKGFAQLDSARLLTGHLPMTHNDCLVIEDSPPGVTGARLADLPVLGVANTVSADELRAAGAGAVAFDLRDWVPDSIRLVFNK